MADVEERAEDDWWWGGQQRLPQLADELSDQFIERLQTKPGSAVHPINRPMLIAALAFEVARLRVVGQTIEPGAFKEPSDPHAL